MLPKSAPWLDEFRSELLQFPDGRHDDQVDSLSQFLNWKRAQVQNGDHHMAAVGSKLITLDQPINDLGFRDPDDPDIVDIHGYDD